MNIPAKKLGKLVTKSAKELYLMVAIHSSLANVADFAVFCRVLKAERHFLRAS